jgi:SAM-dependent methyltransferase
MNSFTLGDARFDERRQAARFLRGDGIEIGGAHLPIPVDTRCCRIQYVDRMSATEIAALFPELDGYSIVETDILCNVQHKGLGIFGDETLDFVIASHLIEHLPNPLGFLEECQRVLQTNGILYLVVPDKNYTFDRTRDVTPLVHLVEDFKHDTREVDEHHLEDWLRHIRGTAIPDDPAEKQRVFEWELKRTIHTHVWTWEGVVEFVRHLMLNEGVSWELCEFYLPKKGQDEVILVLRKTSVPPADAVARFDATVETLLDRENAMKSVICSFDRHAQASLPPAPNPRWVTWLPKLGLTNVWRRVRRVAGMGRK